MAAADVRPVLIAGGGIGGLAAALGLAQKGIRSILLEKAAALGEIGAGIQLGPNAFHAFDYLGVGEAARGMAVYIDQLRLMDALTAEDARGVSRAVRQSLRGGASRRSARRVPARLRAA
jgi:2-polyprenyl-6-methoxyphenol hydroxylase-like FAD-dependent oxidoreductase